MDNKIYDEERFNRIERFLCDQMSPEEEKDFMKDMKTDKVLREDARMMALMIKTMNQTRQREEEHIVRMVRHYEKTGRRATAIRPELKTQSHYAPEPKIQFDIEEEAKPEAEPCRKAETCPNTTTTEATISTEQPQKQRSRLVRFMRWAAPVAAMLVLVFGATWFLRHNNAAKESEMVANVPAKQAVKGKKEQARQEEQKTGENVMAMDGEDATAAAADEPVYSGGTLPEIANKPESGVEKMLANIDNQILEQEQMLPVINELQDILDGIKAGKEEYAQYEPYKEKIEWRLTAALAKEGEGCVAKDVVDEMASEGSVIAEMLRKQYQCKE